MRAFGSGALAVVMATCLQAKPPRPARPWSAHEARQATIQKIVIEVGDVFDLSRPDENIWIGRVADRLHASTKEPVIRRVLLFKEGDKVRTRRIYETERLLRALPFVKDAHIDPVQEADGTLVARVRVRDAWTTQVNAGFSSVGGQRSMNFGVDEKNFLGHGKSVAFDIAKDHERTDWGITYMDPQLFASRWTLALQSRYLSDGHNRSIKLERPFFALDTPWSTTLGLSQKKSSLHLYDRTKEVFQAPFIQDEVQWAGAAAFHEAGDRVWRAGLMFDRQDTHYGDVKAALPPGTLTAPTLVNRRLRGAGLTLSTQKDAFETFVDLLGVDTPEDYSLAWNGSLAVGTYSRALGSSMTAPFFVLQAANGWSSSSDDLTLFTLSWDGRVPATGLENSALGLSLVHYTKVTENQIFATLATFDAGRRLDPERWYYLGGDQGLRGFPNFLHPGDARWVVSLDYRLLTEQRWWGLVRLGYCAFVDAGSVRRLDGMGWTRTYTDVGVGLRLGNLKSSLGRVILLSVAAPLNREPYQSKVQFTIGNTVRF